MEPSPEENSDRFLEQRDGFCGLLSVRQLKRGIVDLQVFAT